MVASLSYRWWLQNVLRDGSAGRHPYRCQNAPSAQTMTTVLRVTGGMPSFWPPPIPQ